MRFLGEKRLWAKRFTGECVPHIIVGMTNRQRLLLSLLPAFLVCSCATRPVLSQSSAQESSEQPSSAPLPSSSESEPSQESVTSSSNPSESSSEESSSEPSVQSSSSASSKQTVDATYHFYCVNDFHGSVLERDGNYYEAGIAKLFGKLKEYKDADPEHTFILSAGDMYQGSLESNFNYGALVTDAMNAVPFDAMTLGNHEFDYGQKHLLDNIERADFPVLGGNIMKWEEGRATDKPWNENVLASTTIERGGNKIGIVGMIGQGQTTSISSQFVQDCDFIDPYEPATKESAKLKEEGCDIVILLSHDSIKNTYFAQNKAYFDGVFTGHTHTRELSLKNGVPAIQSYCNGEAISHFDLKIESGVVTCTKYENISASYSWEDDEDIAAIRDQYCSPAFNAIANRVAGTVNGSLGAKREIPNLICKSMFEEYLPHYPNLALAMCNGQRATIRGEITYSDIYKATPFTNHVVIAEVLGEDILNEANYNNTYTGDVDTYATLDPDKTYQIACIDYVLNHQNVEKVYDYFPCLNPGGGGRILADYENYPFDIVFDYCVNELGGIINANDFANSAPGFCLYA